CRLQVVGDGAKPENPVVPNVPGSSSIQVKMLQGYTLNFYTITVVRMSEFFVFWNEHEFILGMCAS
ncbi:MAG: hypothetical protein ACO211_14085, partial [bacterium]